MSKVSIQGDPNGTGDFTIKAPNSNNNRTLTIPDSDGEFLFTDSNGDLSVDGDTLHVDSVNNRVGVGTSSPAYEMELAKGNAGGVGPTLYLHNTVNDGAAGHSADIRFNLRTGESATRNAIIRGQSEGSFGRNPSILFLTSSGSTGSPTERARIDFDGNFKFDSGYGSAATAYGCRAWVNFDGQGTVSIRKDGNVSSVTERGTGRYTVNFTNAMPDSDYAALYTGQKRPPSDDGYILGGVGANGQTNSAVEITTQVGSSGPDATPQVSVAVFR